MLRYASLYANRVHQLVVSPSKHYYFTKDGRLKEQGKPIEVTLERIAQSGRLHLVHYIIRDHFSGLFYWEVASSGHLLPIEQFLYRAWTRKSDVALCGVPELLTIPKTVLAAFPSIMQLVAEVGVRPLKVTSGFQGGVRDIRTAEIALLLAREQSIEAASWRAIETAKRNDSDMVAGGSTTKAARWRDNLNAIRYPPIHWSRGCVPARNHKRPEPGISES